ncbi:MAG TPA: T9SS type A sorting domain-containing protein [Cyclobacteriaceae bacterium]|nr:T9SS type A sorting domain-containing protein [Cyclobacteriaceae bacterium]
MPFALRAQQSIAPSVNNLAGIDGKLSDAFVTTSIGEPAITTISSKGSIITQGFLQPEILPCTELEFKYYPNPARDLITIEAYGCEVRIESMDIVDLTGRLITTAKPTRENELNLGDLAQGVYFVKVKLTNQDVHTISVVKTSN